MRHKYLFKTDDLRALFLRELRVLIHDGHQLTVIDQGQTDVPNYRCYAVLDGVDELTTGEKSYTGDDAGIFSDALQVFGAHEHLQFSAPGVGAAAPGTVPRCGDCGKALKPEEIEQGFCDECLDGADENAANQRADQEAQ